MSNSLNLTIRLDANGNAVGFINQATGALVKFDDAADKASDSAKKIGGESQQSFGKATTETKKLGGALDSATSSSDRLAERVQDMAHLAGIGFLAVQAYDFHKQLLLTTATLESMGKAYGAVFGNTQAIDEMHFIKQTSQSMGLAFMDAANQYKSFAAATNDTLLEGQATKSIFLATASAAATLGLSAEQSGRAFLAMSQMAGKGVVSMEELRGQLAEAIPGAVGLAANAMGVSIAELNKMVETGTVLSSDLLPKLADELYKVYGVSANGASNLTADINRMKNAVHELGVAYTSGWADEAQMVIRDMTAFFSDSKTVESAKQLSVYIGDTMRTLRDNKEIVLTITGALIGLRGGWVGAIVGAAGGFSASQIVNDTDINRITSLKKELAEFNTTPLNWQSVGWQREKIKQEIAYLEEWQRVAAKPVDIDYRSAVVAGTQLQELTRQTDVFGLTTADNIALIGQSTLALNALGLANKDVGKGLADASKQVQDLNNQLMLSGLSARDAAIAQAALKTASTGGSKEQVDQAVELTAKLYDQNKAAQALAEAKTQAAAAIKKAAAEAKSALDKWFNEGFSGAEKASARLSEFHTKLESDLQRIRYEIDPTLEAFDQYNSKLNTLALAMQTGKITADEYHQAIYQLDSKQFDSPLSGMKDKGLDDLRELKQAIDGWGKDSARSIADFALSGKGSFSDFSNSVIKDLMTMMIYQNMTKPLMTAAGSWMSSLFNGGMNWSSGNAVVAAQNASFNANGNAFTGVGIQAFANGGTFTNSIVNSPTAFKFANGGKFNLGVMGEAGPEAVMPLTRIGGKLGVLAQGGGGGHTNVIVNVMNSAGDSVQANARQSTNSNGDTVIDVMVDRVKGALLQDVGSNGQFSQAFSGAYGLSRRAF